MSKPVTLVACAKTKADRPLAAKDLYISPWFRKVRRYVEASGSEWFILSAQHGLLAPDTVIEPYEKTLHDMSRSERHAWADGVFRQLVARRLTPGFSRRVIFFAGEAYRDPLASWLTLGGLYPAAIEAPLEGMGLGRQLAWLTANAPSDAAPVPSASAVDAIDWSAVPDDRPPVNDNNEDYMAYLRAQMPRRRVRGPGSSVALSGLDTPLFRQLLAG